MSEKDRFELLDAAALLLKDQDQTHMFYRVAARAVWSLLSGLEQETLVGLIKFGPVYDGDVVSKTARSTLIDLGLAHKAISKGEQGYQVANYKGWAVWKAGQ